MAGGVRVGNNMEARIVPRVETAEAVALQKAAVSTCRPFPIIFTFIALLAFKRG